MPSPALPRCVLAAPPHHHRLEPVLLPGACLPQKLCPLGGPVAGCRHHYCHCHCRCRCHCHCRSRPSFCHLQAEAGNEGNKNQPGAAAQGSTLAEARPQHSGSRWDWRPQSLSAPCTVLPTLCPVPLATDLGRDPWKLTWIGLLLLGNLLQATQQGIDVGLDLGQLCLDGLQLTALY